MTEIIGSRLAVHGLSCRRGDRLVFRDVSLSVGSHDVLEVAGPNGCGKTSLLRVLCGLAPPEEGEMTWCGRAIPEVRIEYLGALAYVGHADGIKSDLTAIENLRVSRALGNGGGDPEAALAHLGLAELRDLPGRLLSAGQRRRLALARLLVHDARLWLLDEPFTALDKAAISSVASLIEAHAARGGMVVFTSHHHVAVTQARRMDLAAGT